MTKIFHKSFTFIKPTSQKTWLGWQSIMKWYHSCTIQTECQAAILIMQQLIVNRLLADDPDHVEYWGKISHRKSFNNCIR